MENLNEDKVVITLGSGKVLYLNSKSLNEEIAVDELLQVDTQNLIADIVTFPVVMQKVGMLLAKVNNKVAEAELNLRIWQAKKREKIRLQLEESGEKATESKIEDKMRSDPMYLTLKKHQIQQQKNQEYINNLFWSVKSKDNKLDKLSLTLKQGDIEETLVKGAINKINGVNIKMFKH